MRPHNLLFVTITCTMFAVISCKDKIKLYQSTSNSLNCSDDSSCPTWFRCNTEKNKCVCGRGHHGMVHCKADKGRVALSNCHCMTFDNKTKDTVVGACFYNCENTTHKKLYDEIYHPLPINAQLDLNQAMCGRFNRTGMFCGKCVSGHKPFVLSYNFSCVHCPNSHNNWWKFVLAGFGPLTFFYFFMVLLNINVTSSHLHGVVLLSHGIAMPALTRILLLTLQTRPRMLAAVKAIIPFYSIWNLDFFRSVIPDICMDVTTVQALAFDYAVAVYPILLITLSYILITLYDNNCLCIMYIWRPFHKIFSLFKENWDVRTSVIDSFSTFFLLSYVKVLSVSGDLLIYTYAYSLNGTVSMRLYYDSSLPYFGKEHLPYGILALIVLTIFVAIPTTVLSLYPFQFFQKFLSCFPIQWHFLHTFVDSFQGCYKDGTEPGTCDCRFFAHLTLFVRLGFFVTYMLTLSAMYFVYTAILGALWLILLINVNPFKKTAASYPSTDKAFLTFIIIFYVSILGVNIASMESHHYVPAMDIVCMSAPFVSLVYILYVVLRWIALNGRCFRRNRLPCWRR